MSGPDLQFAGLICPRRLDRLKQASSATLSWWGEERDRLKAGKFSDARKAPILKQGEEGCA
jgi:hypothetical protein